MKAVIDIGTNSVLLLMGERDASGAVVLARDEARVARLGQDVARTGVLRDDAIERTVAILADYAAIAREAGAPVTAVATEGLRLASNQEVFLERAKAALGTPVRLISGVEEARLSYLSVAHEYADDRERRVIDIGGASTELVVGAGESVHSATSHKVGSVRLTEACVSHDPPHREEIEAVAAAARAAFASQPLAPSEELYGLAGTVTTTASLLLGLAAYDREQVDGTRWTRTQVTMLRDELAAEPLAVRVERPCLPAGRADVIVAGLTILDVAMAHCGATQLVVRDRGLRYALLS